ncbi:hypothetical protein J2Y63_004142 [Shinella sp. BE166]|uniref:hypothetical protein n=1 Tax=Shinella sp. BE166 TaxID=3373918 RepID=UPI003EBE023E
MNNALTDTNLVALADRISVINAKFVNSSDVQIAFDIAVDGNVVHGSLEWLTDDLELCHEDAHLDINSEFRHDIAAALGEADVAIYREASLDARSGVLGDIAEIVHDKLVAAHAELKDEMLPELEDWWYIAKPSASGDGIYGFGSEREAAEYSALLNERDDREYDCWAKSEVKLAEALSVVDKKQGFVLEEGLAELKDQIAEAA